MPRQSRDTNANKNRWGLPDNFPSGLTCRKVFIPDDPYYVSQVIGRLHTLQQQIWYDRDEDHTAKKIAQLWKVANQKTFSLFDNPCNVESFTQSPDSDIYPPSAAFIEWYPHDPHVQPELVPVGYLNPPWQVVDQVTPGAGDQVGDVSTDILGAPLAVNIFNLLDVISSYPGCIIRVNNAGSENGIMRLKLIALPNGGRVIALRDDNPLHADTFDAQAFSIVDIPGWWEFIGIVEDGGLNDEFIEEIVIPPGQHFVRLIPVPTTDDIANAGYGFGLRSVELDGIGLEPEYKTMPDFEIRQDGHLWHKSYDAVEWEDLGRVVAPVPVVQSTDDPNGTIITFDMDADGTEELAVFVADGAAGADGADGADGSDNILGIESWYITDPVLRCVAIRRVHNVLIDYYNQVKGRAASQYLANPDFLGNAWQRAMTDIEGSAIQHMDMNGITASAGTLRLWFEAQGTPDPANWTSIPVGTSGVFSTHVGNLISQNHGGVLSAETFQLAWETIRRDGVPTVDFATSIIFAWMITMSDLPTLQNLLAQATSYRDVGCGSPGQGDDSSWNIYVPMIANLGAPVDFPRVGVATDKGDYFAVIESTTVDVGNDSPNRRAYATFSLTAVEPFPAGRIYFFLDINTDAAPYWGDSGATMGIQAWDQTGNPIPVATVDENGNAVPWTITSSFIVFNVDISGHTQFHFTVDAAQNLYSGPDIARPIPFTLNIAFNPNP